MITWDKVKDGEDMANRTVGSAQLFAYRALYYASVADAS